MKSTNLKFVFWAALLLLGFVAGGALTGLGLAWQGHVARTRPEGAWAAMGLAFLIKLVGVLLGALACRYIEAVAERADYRSFLVAFALTSLVLLLLGAPSAARGLRTGASQAQGGAASS